MVTDGVPRSTAESRPIDRELIDWYTDVDDEETRLSSPDRPHAHVEAVRTRELIEARIAGPAPQRVLDVGGGAGAHARWLAGLGHRVELVDPVHRHVVAAAQLDGVTADIGDARSLHHEDSRYDLVLCLGPLYHLRSRQDRVQALRECGRVATPGAPLLAAAIGRYHVVIEYVLNGALDRHYQQVLGQLIATGENTDDHGFPLRHGHTSDESRAEAEEAGWQEIQVLGIEGPVGWPLNLVPVEGRAAAIEQAIVAARMVENDPRVIDMSPHLMVIGTAP